MKDRTNKTKPALKPTIEGIGLMCNSLQSLYEDEYPKSPRGFALMAQGPIDQIRDLLEDVEWLMEDMVSQRLSESARVRNAIHVQEVAAMQDAA